MASSVRVDSGDAQQAHEGLRDDAERALGADDDAGEVVAGQVARGAAGPDDAAVRQHQLEAEDVVGRDAVGQAVRPAGVLGDVAADGAGALAGGVGGVVEAVLRDGLAQLQVDDAGLDQRGQVLDVDLEDALHARHGDEHAAHGRDGAAAEAGAGAARHHGQVVARARS